MKSFQRAGCPMFLDNLRAAYASPKKIKQCLVLFLLFAVMQVSATTYYVKPTASGTGTGASWTNASADLQAIINASTSGDQIWVAAGTYLPSRDYSGNASPGDARTKTFTLKNGVALYGGFNGTESLLSERNATTNITILSGEIGTVALTDNVYHVVMAINLTNTTIFDGFTVRDGYANGGSATYGGNTVYHTFGGGLFNGNCTYTVSNIIFRNNYGNEGAALVNSQAEGISPTPTVTVNDCKFISNTSNNNAAALYTHASICNINRSVFDSNIGGGIAAFPYGNFVVDRCVFVSNTSTAGGAARMRKGSMLLKNSVFANNSATNGGAVYVVDENNESSSNIYNCTFYNNSATTDGSAFWGAGSNMINCIFNNNTGGTYAIQGRNQSSVQYSLISASTINQASSSSLVAGAPAFSNTADLDGTDNIWGTADDGLVITAGSAAYNAGTNAQVQTPTLDIVGNARTQFTTVDLGAYESTTNLNASSDATLSALTTTAGTLTPSFSSATIAYTASVTNATTSVTVTPTRNEANATIQVQVNSGGYSTVTSGSPSAALSLNVGANPIDIKVTAQDGTTIKTYTITVTRAVGPVVSSISPTNGGLGTIVTITGTNLTSATDVTVGGGSAIILSNTATQITAYVAPGAATGVVSVTTASGSGSSSGSFTLDATAYPKYQISSKFTGSGGSVNFGNAIKISADKSTAVIGAFYDNSQNGAVWIYTRSGDAWTQQGTKLTPSDNTGAARFGASVDISADGNTIIVGGYQDNSNFGAAWIFVRTGSTWAQQGSKLTGTGNTGSTPYMGQAVGLSADGNTAFVSGYGDNSFTGAAWVFTRSGTTWTQQGSKLTSTSGSGVRTIGQTGGISADGNTLVLGGSGNNNNSGAAWVFVRSGSTWSQQAFFGSGGFFGTSTAVSADGNTAAFGGPDANSYYGYVWVYKRTGTTWSQQAQLGVGNGTSNGAPNIGRSMALSADGNTLMTGGPADSSNLGAVFVWTRSGSTWTQQGRKLVGTGSVGYPGSAIQQGGGLAIAADGTWGMSGAMFENSSKGAVWAFKNTQSANADLSALSLSTGVFSPTFAAATTTYTVNVGSNTSVITVFPTTSDVNATIQARVNGGSYSSVTSGGQSSALSLSLSTNTIDVLVTAQDGSTIKTYTITVNKVVLPVPTIASFSPSSAVAGTSVTITGTNFSATQANNIVYFGATKATVTAATTNSLTVTVPASASYAPISILNTTSQLSATSSARFNPIFTPSKGTLAASDFASVLTFTPSSSSNTVGAGTCDFDGDGKPELVVCNYGNTNLSVHPNTSTSGSISFGTQVNLTAGSNTRGLALTDVDGDGKPDIVAVGSGNDKVSIYLNTSSGTGNVSFAAKVDLTMAGNGGGGVVVGDLDGDGRPDIAATAGGYISVFTNMCSVGTVNFSVKTDIAAPNFPVGLAIGDMDGDGKLDLVSGNYATNTTNVSVYLNTTTSNGTVTFTRTDLATAASKSNHLAVGDLDGDNKLDIAVSNDNGSTVSIFKNNSTTGNLSFGTHQDFTANTAVNRLSIGDLDGDGKPDIAASAGASTNMTILKNNTTSSTISFASKIDLATGTGSFAAEMGDLDGDGKIDLIYPNFGSSILIYRNLSLYPTWAGTTSTAWATATNWNTGAVPTSSDPVIIPSGTTNAPTVSATQSVKALTVNSGATVTLNGNLQVSGTVVNNGTLTGTSALVLNGSSAQDVSGTGSISNLTLNNSTGATISSGMTSLTGTLTLTSGTLTTGGFLTLKSDATSTARIAAIASGSISGNITQERYIPAKSVRTWSLVASPFTQTISNAWQQQVHITGAGTGGTVCPSLTQHSNGFDATVTNAASMFVYDGTKAVGSRWTSVTGTSSVSLSAGTGYRMNIRGPRSTGCSLLDGTVSTTAAVTLSSTGTLSNANKNMGSFTTTVSNNADASGANDNYLLIGNPYPSQISFSALRTANSSVIANSYATFAPGNTVGNYAFWNGATWSGGNTGLSNGTGDIIASGQAFFVKGAVAGANISLSWTESMKSTAAQTGYFRTNQLNPNRLRIGYFLANGNKADEVMVEFAEKVSNTEINDGDGASFSTRNL